jgi:predicted small lipoprotein YifL
MAILIVASMMLSACGAPRPLKLPAEPVTMLAVGIVLTKKDERAIWTGPASVRA